MDLAPNLAFEVAGDGIGKPLQRRAVSIASKHYLKLIVELFRRIRPARAADLTAC
jgi:hypothetical protein